MSAGAVVVWGGGFVSGVRGVHVCEKCNNNHACKLHQCRHIQQLFKVETK